MVGSHFEVFVDMVVHQIDLDLIDLGGCLTEYFQLIDHDSNVDQIQ